MAVTRAPQRGDVWLVQLNPTRGSEIRKTRPWTSPDLMDAYMVGPTRPAEAVLRTLRD
jgi:hypothetical protein